MLRRLQNKRGQNTAEYAIVIGLIIAAAIVMQTYVKRGLQGRVKDAVDYKLGGEVGADDTGHLGFVTTQYEPYYTDTSFASTAGREETAAMQTGGSTSKELTKDESARLGTQNTLQFNATDAAQP